MTKSRRFYISVEVDFFDHAKTKEVGERLAFRHLKAVAWCHRYATDGFIAKDAALSIVFSSSAAARLEAAGLWEKCDKGWRVHDYLEHQPSKDDIAKWSDAGKRGAEARYAKR